MTTNSDTTAAAPARWLAIGAAVVSLIAGGLVLSPIEADAGGSPPPAWFKPPWPCIVVRAELPGMPRSGFCPSPNVARWLPTTPADALAVADATPIVAADAYHGVGFIACPDGEPPVTVADAYHGVGVAVCFDAARQSRPASP